MTALSYTTPAGQHQSSYTKCQREKDNAYGHLIGSDDRLGTSKSIADREKIPKIDFCVGIRYIECISLLAQG